VSIVSEENPVFEINGLGGHFLVFFMLKTQTENSETRPNASNKRNALLYVFVELLKYSLSENKVFRDFIGRAKMYVYECFIIVIIDIIENDVLNGVFVVSIFLSTSE